MAVIINRLNAGAMTVGAGGSGPTPVWGTGYFAATNVIDEEGNPSSNFVLTWSSDEDDAYMGTGVGDNIALVKYVNGTCHIFARPEDPEDMPEIATFNWPPTGPIQGSWDGQKSATFTFQAS